MSDEIFAQCVTLIGYAAIPKSLLAVPTPTEEDAGKLFSAGEDRSVGWTKLPEISDDDFIDELIDLDALYAVSDSDGSILSDENENILLW